MIAAPPSTPPTTESERRLLQACFDADFDKAKFLVERKVALDTRDISGVTPLLAACRTGSVRIVELLLKSGASPQSIDYEAHGAFLSAARKGHADLCVALARSGADVNEIHPSTGFTALHYAAQNDHLDLAKALLPLGVERSVKDLHGRTARDLAEEVGATEIFDLLAGVPAERRKTKRR